MPVTPAPPRLAYLIALAPVVVITAILSIALFFVFPGLEWQSILLRSFLIGAPFSAPLIALLLLAEPIATRTRRAGRERIEVINALVTRDASLTRERRAELIAERARLTAADSHRDALIDTESLEDIPGAVLVAFRHAWPKPTLQATPSEEIDLGASRRRGSQEHRVWIFLLVMSLAAIVTCVIVLPARGLPPGHVAMWTIPGFLGVLLTLRPMLAQLGVLPVELSATLVSPGRVERVNLGRSRVFTTADSIVVLERISLFLDAYPHALGLALARISRRWPRAGRAIQLPIHAYVRRGWLARWRRLERALRFERFRRPIRAVILRDDGLRFVMRFVSGRNDPALAEFVARWTEETPIASPAKVGTLGDEEGAT